MRLTLDNVQVQLGARRVLNSISFAVQEPAFIGLIGPNGAGKTTLMRAIAAILPFMGEISLDGVALSGMQAQARARRLAYLAQSAASHWPLEVSRLVALGRLPHLAPFQEPGPQDEAAITRAMAFADVESFRGRDVTTLSGGERARVLLARALAVEAPLLLVDEPVASLDLYHQLCIMEMLKAYAGEGRIVIVVMHDLALAARFCDRLILLDRGAQVADGTSHDVLTSANLQSVYRVRAIIEGENAGFVRTDM